MKTVPKTLIVILLFVLISVSLISYASAITGSIGNARMIISKDSEGDEINIGDEIKKYVLVRNSNNVSVDIDIFASGDLADYIDIEDDKFTLVAGEEKKAYFVVKVGKGGTTESRINVQFTPPEGSGVGLSSTVIVVEKGQGGFLDQLFGNNDEEEDPTQQGVTLSTSHTIGGNGNSDDESKGMNGRIVFVIILTSTVVVIFIVVLVLYYLKMKKDGEIKDTKIKKDGEKGVKKEDKKSVKTKTKKSVKKK